MNQPTIYDKAKYHTDGKWPEGLDSKQSFVHTGLFLGWLIDRDLLSEEFQEDAEDEIEAFKQRKMSGPQVYSIIDGVLVDEMLSDAGNAFTRFYFDFKKGQFLKDYGELLAVGLPSEFYVQDTCENYTKLKARLDQRFEEWKSKTP